MIRLGEFEYALFLTQAVRTFTRAVGDVGPYWEETMQSVCETLTLDHQKYSRMGSASTNLPDNMLGVWLRYDPDRLKGKLND